jgi:hypothetical protein
MSLVTREMQIKSTTRYHFIPTKKAKNMIKIKSVGRHGEIAPLTQQLWECKMGKVHAKQLMVS